MYVAVVPRSYKFNAGIGIVVSKRVEAEPAGDPELRRI